jgi:hypothetical protein
MVVPLVDQRIESAEVRSRDLPPRLLAQLGEHGIVHMAEGASNELGQPLSDQVWVDDL